MNNKKLLSLSWLVILLIVVFTGVFVTAMKSNTRMETDLDEYMPQKHPAFIYSNEAEDLFGIKDGIIVAIEHQDGIYNEGTLQKIKDLTREIQAMEGIEKSDVTSLYTADNIVGSEYGMEVNAFYKRVPASEAKLNQLRDDVRANDMIYGRLVSENENVTIIIAEINDDTFTDDFYSQILALGESYEGPETVYVAGVPIVEGELGKLAPKDMARMAPLVVGIIIIVLLLILRSFKGTVLNLLVVLLSTIWTFGLMAVLNIPIYSVSTMIPVMLIAIGVADGIHLFNHLELYIYKNPNASKVEVLKDLESHLWKPVVMTSVTTAVGFISLITSEVYPVKYFGIFTAFGVLAAMFFALFLIPAGLMIVGLPKPRQFKSNKSMGRNFAFKFADKIAAKKGMTILIAAFVIAISLFGISSVWINSSFLANFEDDSAIVRTDRFINENFAGTSSFNVVLEADKNDIFKNPDALMLVDNLQNDLEELEMVGDTFSLADFIRRMNKVMNEDREDYNTIPNSTEMIAQYLLLYEMSGDPENLTAVVDYDYKTLNLTAQMKSDDSKTIKGAIDVVEEYRDDFKDLGVDINFAGSGYKGMVFADLILKGQISSLVLSILIVIILITVMFKNFIISLIASVPILITTFVNFGIMGLLNIPLGPTTALISSIAVGIGIDYAIHFIDRYKEYAIETVNKKETARLTMYNTGRAILFNAVVVIAGFLVLLFSMFPPNRQLGALVSLNMFSSFVGTLTIMFLLLYISNTYFKIKKKGEK
ncbi:MAG: MMPL family transporter [Spirochaetota bacterium]|nr:MMPL family transporter [Spirochaetota bacterium]